MERKVRCWKFGKWSWKFERCIWCGTNRKTYKTRHKGNGLCIGCFDKKRGQNPMRKSQKRKAHLKFNEKFKKNPNYKELTNARALKYRLTSKTYQRFLKKNYLRGQFKRFLIRKRKTLKRWNTGIEIIIDGERIRTPIKPLENTLQDKQRVIIESNIFREVYRKNKNLTTIDAVV